MKISIHHSLIFLLASVISLPLSAKLPHHQDKTWVHFALKAKSAVIKKAGSNYEITLQGIHRDMSWFNDRPVHKSGVIPSELFIDRWEKLGQSFASTPPHANISFECPERSTHCVKEFIPVELSNPKKINHHTWTFTLTSSHNHDISGKYQQVTVSIDLLKEYSSIRHVPTVDLTGY